MKQPITIMLLFVAGGLFSQNALAQTQVGDSNSGPAPIYHVTVIERTTTAVNYRYRSGPTTIGFRGTVLLPDARGSAVVTSKQGRTEIDAKLDKLTSPARFGAEYLTYVLWAVSPDGRPHNLGEVVANSSDHGHIYVTTDLQAFALILTAEPHSAVRQPSDVVVAENEIRPETVGRTEEVRAKYELLPRGQYAWNVPAKPSGKDTGPKLSSTVGSEAWNSRDLKSRPH